MSDISVKEAEHFGLRLDPDQREMYEGGHRFGLVLQTIPDPWCWVTQGCTHPVYACTVPGPGEHPTYRVNVPTIIDFQGAAEAALLDDEWVHNQHYTQQGYNTLPMMHGFATDLARLAIGQDCGCGPAMQCGCWPHEITEISPYTVVPLNEEQAMEFYRAAQLMQNNAFPAMCEIAEVESGMVSAIDILGDPDDDALYQRLDENDPAAWAEVTERALAPAYEFIGWDPSQELHLTQEQLSYPPPPDLEPLVERLEQLHRRQTRGIKRLFKRDARTRTAQTLGMFAYPTVDSPPVI